MKRGYKNKKILLHNFFLWYVMWIFPSRRKHFKKKNIFSLDEMKRIRYVRFTILRIQFSLLMSTATNILRRWLRIPHPNCCCCCLLLIRKHMQTQLKIHNGFNFIWMGKEKKGKKWKQQERGWSTDLVGKGEH